MGARNVTTTDFIALAERENGQQLDAFLEVWLDQPVKTHELVATPA